MRGEQVLNRGEVWWYEMPDNLLPVPKGLLTERITHLRPSKLAELCRALNIAVGC